MVFKFGLLIAMCLSVALAKRICPCSMMEDLVCGSDNTTYRNICELECATYENPTITLVNNGSCVEKSGEESGSSECTCLRELNPVCGSDGNTYDNYCELECAMEDDPSLLMVSAGSCNESKDDKSHKDEMCDCSLLKPNDGISLYEHLKCCATSQIQNK